MAYKNEKICYEIYLPKSEHDTGLRGPNGDKGVRGLKGDKGESVVAITSLKGFKGDQGDDGAKGDKGTKGTKGDIGQKGEPGNNLNNTFELSHLKGVSLPDSITYGGRGYYEYRVPETCYKIDVQLWGGGGGGNDGFVGGAGEYVRSQIDLIPNLPGQNTLIMLVGSGGLTSQNCCGGGGSSAVYAPNYGVITMASGGGGAANYTVQESISATIGGGGGAGPRGGNGGGSTTSWTIGMTGYPAGYPANSTGKGGDSRASGGGTGACGGGGGVFGGGSGGIRQQSSSPQPIYVLGGGTYTGTGTEFSGASVQAPSQGNGITAHGSGGGGIYTNTGMYNRIPFIGTGGNGIDNATKEGAGDANTGGKYISGIPLTPGVTQSGPPGYTKTTSYINAIATYVKPRTVDIIADYSWDPVSGTNIPTGNGHGGNATIGSAATAYFGGDGRIIVTEYYL
jgi:hypothetical protein